MEDANTNELEISLLGNYFNNEAVAMMGSITKQLIQSNSNLENA